MRVAAPTAIDRGLQRVAAVIITFYLANAVMLFWPRAGDARPESTGFIIIACCVGVSTILRAATVRLSRVDAVTTLAAMVSGLMLDDLWNTTGVGDAGGPASAMLTMAVITQVLTLLPRTAAFTGVATVLLYASGRGLALGPSGWWDGLEEGLALGAYVIGFTIAINILRQADATAAAAAAEEERAHDERVAARAAQVADRESQRILHDDVIASLLAIDLARGEGGEHAVREAARRARDAFERLETEPEVSEDTGSQMSYGSVVPRYTGDRRLHDFIPEEVQNALTMATSEAIRNAARHAKVDSVWIHRTVADNAVTVTIRDKGAGFRVDDVPGFGLSHGIFGRMRDVGGSAQIDSHPGGGTVVTLTWDGETNPEEADDLIRVVVPRLNLLAATTLAILTVLPLRHMWSSRDPLLSGLVALASIALTLALAEAATRGHRRRVFVVTALAIQLLLLTANVMLVGDVRLPNFDLWMIIFVDACLAVIAFAYPARVSLLCGITSSAYLAGLVAFFPHVSTASAGAVLEPTLVSFGATGLTASIRQARRVATELLRQASRAGSAAAAAMRTAEALRQRLAALRGSVLPFLHGLDDGTIDATDPNTLAKARALALEARDELYLHGVLDNDLRELLRQARAGGCNLTIRAQEDAGATPHAAMLLRHALDSTTQQAVIVLPHQRAGETRLRMSPPLSETAMERVRTSLADLDVRIVTDAETTTVSVI